MAETASEFLNTTEVSQEPVQDSLSPEDLDAVIRSAPLGPVANIGSTFAPRAVQAALDAQAGVSGRNVPFPSLLQSQQKFITENQRPGVPLELESQGMGSLDTWTRLQADRRKNAADQIFYLNQKLGPGKARLSKDQKDIIVTVPDPVTPGKEKDVLLNEQNISLNDVLTLSKHAPEVAASIVAMALPELLAPKAMASAPGFVRGLVTLLAGTLGQQAGEAASEIETRIETGQPLQIGETLKQEASQTPKRAALDLATAGVFKAGNLALKIARAPVGFWNTPVQIEGRLANQRLAEKLGVEPIRMTPGEASGQPLLIFGEAYAKAKPQARAAWDKFTSAQEADKQAVGRAMTALSGTDEQVGQDLIKVMQQTRAEKDAALDALRSTMTTQEAANLDKAIGKSISMPSVFKPSEAGAAAREGVQDLFETVRTKVGKAYDIPGMKTMDIPTDDLALELKNISFKAANVPGLAGTIPTELEAITSYEQLKNMRSMLRQKIEDSPADRTVKDYYAGQVDSAITAKMEDAAKTVRDPAFKKQIDAANKLYRTEQLPFYQEGIGDILRKAGSPGSPENMEILNRFRGNTDLYRRLVEVTGKNSKPVKIVKQSIMDGVLTEAGTEAVGSKFVDAGRLVEKLLDLKTNPKTREMFVDVFGVNGDKIIKQAQILGSVQGTIPREEAIKILSATTGRSARNIKAVLDEQDSISREYSSTLLKDIKGGTFDPKTVNPQEFVNRVMPTATPSEIKAIKAEILSKDPTLLPAFQDKVVEQILGKAGTYDRSSILGVLEDPKMVEKYRTILDDKFGNVKDFAVALGPIEAAGQMAEGTGMLVKGQSIGALARLFRPSTGGKGPGLAGKVVEEIPGWMGWKLATKIILSGPVRAWAKNATPEDIPNLLKAAIISEPVLADLVGKGMDVVTSHAVNARDYFKRAGVTTTGGAAQPQAGSARDFLTQP